LDALSTTAYRTKKKVSWKDTYPNLKGLLELTEKKKTAPDRFRCLLLQRKRTFVRVERNEKSKIASSGVLKGEEGEVEGVDNTAPPDPGPGTMGWADFGETEKLATPQRGSMGNIDPAATTAPQSKVRNV